MKKAIQWYLNICGLVTPIRIRIWNYITHRLKPGKIEKKNQIKSDFTPKLPLQ